MATVPESQPPLSSVVVVPDDGAPAVSVPPSALTHEGFRKWAQSDDFPQTGKLTFLAGELIVDMSPEYFDTHNFIKTEVTSVIHQLVKQQQSGRVFSDRTLFTNLDAGVSTEPDALFVSHESMRSGWCRREPSATRPGDSMELVGAPDWVLEIVSRSSLRKDKKLLRDAYYRAGVGEYWIIDALGDAIEFQLLTRGEKEYEAAQPQDDWLKSPTFDQFFQLTREVDAEGLAQYTLAVQ